MVALLGLGHQIYSHTITRIQVQNTQMNLKKIEFDVKLNLWCALEFQNSKRSESRSH
jgi:hypothetical protein